jgi:hypothetical protein
MKVIDLLNKIANNEELPEKIKYYGNIYYKYNHNGYFYAIGWEEETLLDDIQCTSQLNDEIEIIEEKPEKIEHYDMFDYFTGYSFSGTDRDLLDHLQRNFENINHELDYLIRQVNYLLEKESDK